MLNTAILKSYVDENNQTVFVCPSCGFEKRFDASPFKNRRKKLSIKCKCGQAMEMEIEFRKHMRKQVELFGTCTLHKDKKKYDIIVKDISIQGIGFEFMFSDQKYVKDLANGDLLTVEFKLDESKSETIIKKSSVCAVAELRIGAEFQDENYSKKLGFFLMG